MLAPITYVFARICDQRGKFWVLQHPLSLDCASVDSQSAGRRTLLLPQNDLSDKAATTVRSNHNIGHERCSVLKNNRRTRIAGCSGAH